MSVEELMEGIATLEVDSFMELRTLAQTLGPNRTREELLPILSQVSDNDPNDILIWMAQHLGDFIPLVGGIEHAVLLLNPLENISTAEDPHVRQMVVHSLCKIGSLLREEDVREHFIPIVKRLAAASEIWSIARASSCGLFAVAYPDASEPLKDELKMIYIKLCRDASNMVREAASINFGEFAATIEQPYWKNEVISIHKNHTHDDGDSVGISAVKGGSSALGKLLEQAQDKSWQVCDMIPERLKELYNAVGPDATRMNLVSTYIWLLCDDNDEVRRAAAGQLHQFCQIVSPELLFKHILDCVMICNMMHNNSPEQFALSWALDSLLYCWRTRLQYAEHMSQQSPGLLSHPIEHRILTDNFTYLVASMLLSLCDNDDSLLCLISTKLISLEGLFKHIMRAERFIVHADSATSEGIFKVVGAKKFILHGDIVKVLHDVMCKSLDYQFRITFTRQVLFDGISFYW